MRRVMTNIDDNPDYAKNVNGNTFFVHSDIDRAGTLNPFTHIYMFDSGFPPELHFGLATKFNKSMHASHLISFMSPLYIIYTFGFKVKFLHKFSTSMHGVYCRFHMFYPSY